MLVIHVDFEGQDHRPKFTDTKGNVAKVVGATSSESFLVLTRHRVSTSTRWHFAFALCCHSKETRAPIAKPPNSAQLGGTPYHSFPSYTTVIIRNFLTLSLPA